MNTSIKRHTLGKAEKLKSRKQVQQLFASGTAFTAFPVRVVFAASEIPEVGKSGSQESVDESAETGVRDVEGKVKSVRMPVQIGVSVSTRNFKRAHDRNRIKRLLREAYRVQKHELLEACRASGKNLDVFFIYVDKVMPDQALLQDKMRYCLKRLMKGIAE